MNILILNWRDPYNPKAGGAEQITLKYANFWVSKGNKVYWVSNYFTGAKKYQKKDSIVYYRIGPSLQGFFLPIQFVTFLLKTILVTKKIIKDKQIDFIVDEIHGLPFFTPLYTKVPKVLLVCEVAGRIWDKMYVFPFNIIGKGLEKFVYYIYSNVEIWAISKNTKKDILNINSKLKVKILPLGIEPLKDNLLVKKSDTPTAVFLARLVKMKGIETALLATKEISIKMPNFTLYVIGSGDSEYVNSLKKKVVQYNIQENVKFMGYVSNSEKYSILAKSHFLFHPSYKEGFGLTVLEAGLVNTPSICRKGSSLDELVINNKTGFLVKNASQIANIFIKNYKNKKYIELGKNANINSKKYYWTNILNNSHEITCI